MAAMVCALPWVTSTLADTPKFPTVYYGASYYHEYMPYERLEKDAELMEKAGITVARVGESTWGLFEPRDGEFDFAWLERVVDRLHKAGIKVILGTPTYSIPAWLFKKHPEIQVKQINQPRYTYGLRQMTDLAHPTYRFFAERIIRRLIGHFKDHPAVIGYQLDNETHASGTADVHVQELFREHVKKKFKTAIELNKAWGLNYWGQNIADFDELPPRDGILNPGYKLEWERFQQDIIAGFLAWQAEIVREIKRPDQFIYHDFVGGFPSDVDQYETAKALDIPAVNIYMGLQDEMDGEFIAYCGDINRSLKPGNYLVTETTAQTTGWDSKYQLRLIPDSSGWPSMPTSAPEPTSLPTGTGIPFTTARKPTGRRASSHDLEPGRAYGEVSRIAQELKKIGPELANLRKEKPGGDPLQPGLLARAEFHAFRRYGQLHDRPEPVLQDSLQPPCRGRFRISSEPEYGRLRAHPRAAALYRERRFARPTGGLCPGRRASSHELQERVLQREFDGEMDDGARAAAGRCRVLLSGIQQPQVASQA